MYLAELPSTATTNVSRASSSEGDNNAECENFRVHIYRYLSKCPKASLRCARRPICLHFHL